MGMQSGDAGGPRSFDRYRRCDRSPQRSLNGFASDRNGISNRRLLVDLIYAPSQCPRRSSPACARTPVRFRRISNRLEPFAPAQILYSHQFWIGQIRVFFYLNHSFWDSIRENDRSTPLAVALHGNAQLHHEHSLVSQRRAPPSQPTPGALS